MQLQRINSFSFFSFSFSSVANINIANRYIDTRSPVIIVDSNSWMKEKVVGEESTRLTGFSSFLSRLLLLPFAFLFSFSSPSLVIAAFAGSSSLIERFGSFLVSANCAIVSKFELDPRNIGGSKHRARTRFPDSSKRVLNNVQGVSRFPPLSSLCTLARTFLSFRSYLDEDRRANGASSWLVKSRTRKQLWSNLTTTRGRLKIQ